MNKTSLCCLRMSQGIFFLSPAFTRETLSNELWTRVFSCTEQRIIHRTWGMNQNPFCQMLTCRTFHPNFSMPRSWSFKIGFKFSWLRQVIFLVKDKRDKTPFCKYLGNSFKKNVIIPSIFLIYLDKYMENWVYLLADLQKQTKMLTEEWKTEKE